MGFLSNLFAKKPDSLLLESAKTGRLEKVITALVTGALVEAKDKEGNTALTLAVIGGFRLVADYLISEKLADVNTSNSDGCTPLMYAASVGHLDIVKWLLSKGADIDKKNEDGFNALMWAAYVGNAETLLALLDGGANIKSRNKEGRQAVDLAETEDCLAILRIVAEKRKARRASQLVLNSNQESKLDSESVSQIISSLMVKRE